MNLVPNMGYSAGTLRHLYTELTKEARHRVEDNPEDAVKVGSCVLEDLLAAGFKVKLPRSACFCRKVALGKFLHIP